MNCDRIAPLYLLLERLAFGRQLQNYRTTFLHSASSKRRALVLGDGDGRFAEALARAYPDLEIQCVEKSKGMISQSRRRLQFHRNVRLIQANVFQFDFQPNSYDIVFAHFFFDCFEVHELRSLVARISPATMPNAPWIITEFRQAATGWRKAYTRFWLSTMYLFFRITTGLKTSSLPAYNSILKAAGLKLIKQRLSSTGLIDSEWWQG